METKEEKAQFKDKFKVSFYIDPKTEEKLMEIALMRTREGNKSRKSQLIDEAVELLYKHESNKTLRQ